MDVCYNHIICHMRCTRLCRFRVQIAALVYGMFSASLVMQDLMWCVMSIRSVAQAQTQVLLMAPATAVPLSSRYACLDPYTTIGRLSMISIVCMLVIITMHVIKLVTWYPANEPWLTSVKDPSQLGTRE